MNIESIKAKLIELGALHPTGNVCETLEHCEFYALFLMGEDYESFHGNDQGRTGR